MMAKVLNGEYGSEGVVSTFTKKRPTDEVFAGEMSLKRWVEETLADAVNEAVDAYLLSRDEVGKAEFVAYKNCISSIICLALK